MTTNTERVETAAATTTPPATTKPTVGARAAHVAPKIAKPGRKATTGKPAASRKSSAKTATGKKMASGAGSTYERKYNGKTYVLTAVERDGKAAFQLKDGKSFDSMTAAAKAVTGYKAISGPAFWAPPKKTTEKE
jgi:hypothetical protein